MFGYIILGNALLYLSQIKDNILEGFTSSLDEIDNFLNFVFEDELREVELENFIKQHQKLVNYKNNYNLVLEELKLLIETKNLRYEEEPKENKNKLLKLNLKETHCVIINLELFYNYETNTWKDKDGLKYLIISIIKQKIPVILIGEKDPKTFLPILSKDLQAQFSTTNYITPYHYSKRMFDAPKKLPNGKINSKACVVSFEQIVEDILDECSVIKSYKLITQPQDLKELLGTN